MGPGLRRDDCEYVARLRGLFSVITRENG